MQCSTLVLMCLIVLATATLHEAAVSVSCCVKRDKSKTTIMSNDWPDECLAIVPYLPCNDVYFASAVGPFVMLPSGSYVQTDVDADRSTTELKRQ